MSIALARAHMFLTRGLLKLSLPDRVATFTGGGLASSYGLVEDTSYDLLISIHGGTVQVSIPGVESLAHSCTNDLQDGMRRGRHWEASR